MSEASLDVGGVYRRGERFLLAVDDDLLLTARAGRLICAHPRPTDVRMRKVSVEALCQSWGVSAEILDRRADEFRPRIVPKSARGRGRRGADDRDWKRFRMRAARSS